MRSIRRSLLLYFLALAGLALGAAGLLIDRAAERARSERLQATEELLDKRYEDKAEAEKRKFDETLAAQAQRVANDVQLQYYANSQKEIERYFQMIRLTQLGGLGAGLAPGAPGVGVWLYQVPYNRRVGEAVAKVMFSHLHLEEQPFDDNGELVMVTVQAFPVDRVYRSKAVEVETWDSEMPQFEPNKLIDEKYETRKLRGGAVVRVVALKSRITIARVSRFSRTPSPSSRGTPPPPRPEGSPPSSEPPPLMPPFRNIYVQCGRPFDALDAKLADLEKSRLDERAREAAITESDRKRLRAWLGAIGLSTFAGLFLGGLLLVRRGLKPLNTLSDAVAKVSERDFRLPVEKAVLSEELLPIHDRLTETLSQLRKAFEHDKQAVADISHELRTPVAALLATLDVSLRKPREAEQYRQTLVECRGITKQLQGLVERVMTLASLDAAPETISTAEVDAVELAENCAAVIRPLAEAQGQSLKVIAPYPLMLRTDGEKLREVLLNLLHNAVEYNRPGGSVELSLSNGGPKATFAVKDTGIGMTDDVKSRIFERFYRADPSRTHTGIHAGLGLAIVKECVNRLGGTIRVESRPGEGSEFQVELPA